MQKLDYLIHSSDLIGTLRVFVYNMAGTHYLMKQYFRRTPKYLDEEVTLDRAKQIVKEAVGAGLQVRITNGSDFLVFHSEGGAITFPEGVTVEQFFERIP